MAHKAPFQSVLTLLIFFSGCASNPFKKFYSNTYSGTDLTTDPRVALSEVPRLELGKDPNADGQRLLEDGYIIIGEASFSAGGRDLEEALDQAKEVHSELVYVYTEYLGTVSGVIPWTTPTSETSRSTFYGSAYSGNISSNFYGNATTTTYGTRTYYIPYSVNQYAYYAVFWVKLKSPPFGIHIQDLSPDTKAKLSSNHGVEIIAVVKNSPAYLADFLKGDVILKINGKKIENREAYKTAVEPLAGQTIAVEIFRNGSVINKSVTLGKTWDKVSI